MAAWAGLQEGWGNDTLPFEKYRERNPATILGVKVRYWNTWTGYAEPEAAWTSDDAALAKAAVDKLRLPSPESLRETEPLPRETMDS